MEFTCEYCGIVKNRTPRGIEIYKHHFCSRKCYDDYRKEHGFAGKYDMSAQRKLKELAKILEKKTDVRRM